MTSLASPSTPATVHLALQRARDWVRPRRLETYGSLAMAAAVLGGFGLISQTAGGIPRTPTAEERTAPAAAVAKEAQAFTPFQVRDIAPDKAVALNAAMPIVDGPNPAAQPFRGAAANSTAFARSLECLTEAVYYEAAREPDDGQRAVAQVVLNRVRHPAFPNSVCGVVYQGADRPTGCQFSFTCDGSLYRQPMRSYWDRASAIARAALQGYVFAPVGVATHYHANYVVPYWSPTLSKNAEIATHIFYRWKGDWGQPAAFSQRYGTRESDPQVLRSLALAAEARDRATGAPLGVDSQVAAAKQELPPELAALVSTAGAAGGKARIKMRIPTGRAAEIAARERTAQAEIKLDNSDSMRWSMSGDESVAQKPLGRAPASPPASATAQSVPAKPSGGASE
ncbi:MULTISPECIES: cell wall hydrolase [Sphingomonas]|uniref:cell wall hydrolase n=1 Tax=Sphingomonas TaxID=13687 RepID=UPI000DEFAE1D|nr:MULTISPECIES: cell wall hydrolase [Sphingomonas]